MMTLGFSGFAPGASAQPYPTRTVRVIVPFTASGPTDIVARVVGQRLYEATGQQFIVDNRGGTHVGALLAARAAPDGYTLFLTGIAGLSIAPHMHKSLPYDPVKDYAPISLLTVQPLLLMVHPALPVRSVKEFIALARLRPGLLDYASSGLAGKGHLAGELFKSITKTSLEQNH
jgi:tripartite-type tricarboxylate transporter receptor subunit TctC